ncbi:MAG: hypothetical protein R2731_07860 [Nocardioides sp.]
MAVVTLVERRRGDGAQQLGAADHRGCDDPRRRRRVAPANGGRPRQRCPGLRRPASGRRRWGRRELVGTAGGGYAQLGYDRAGHLVVAWSDSGDAGTTVYARRTLDDGTWGPWRSWRPGPRAPRRTSGWR